MALVVAVACLVGGLIVAARCEVNGVQVAVVLMALGALVALGLAFAVERRQARRAAERAVELEQLSAELIRANRVKSEFLASVSHELRTPLNAIAGFAELLRDGAYGALNTRQAGSVERIESSAAHLQRLVDQILDLARLAAGRMELTVEPVELRPLVIDIVAEVESLMSERGISVSVTLGSTLPLVYTDPSHVRQIVTNLLGNAIKFTPPCGSITIRARLVDAEASLMSKRPRPGKWMVLQVIDSGIGIRASDHERIFDEFEQIMPNTRSDSMPRGTGLGLSISRRIARLLGGDITVASEVDRGSVFSVWLPLKGVKHRSVEPVPRQPATF